MLRKRLWVTVATMAALMLVAGSASAAELEDDKPEHPHRYGHLIAKGTGTVDLDVAVALLGMRVSGDVTITGPADLSVRIDGSDHAPAESDGGTSIVLEDFDGTIVVSGKDFDVHAEGDVYLRGRGAGEASFRGEGWWRTRTKRGLWPADDPVAVALSF